MDAIIQTEKLSHIYSTGTPFEHAALVDVDFTAYRGEYLGIIGRTGSGKSTLIQHLNGLLKPTSGKVLFEGKDIWETKERTHQTRFQVGLVFQYPEYQLFEETVYKDIAFGPKNMKLDEGEVDRRVRAAAAFVGLSGEVLEKSPFELSGGQKRRVAIAGVIAMEPAVLILDATILLVSHSMEEVARSVDRLVVVSKGHIPFTGAPREVFAHGDELEAMGLGVPQVTRVFHRLRAMGVDIDPSVYTIDQARAAVRDYLAGKGAV